MAGNFVGVDSSGNLPLGNARFGIEVSGATMTTVGGEASGDRNVVGANAAGIEVDNGGQNNVIIGNYSGVGANGTSQVGNKLHGIVLRSNGTPQPPSVRANPANPACRTTWWAARGPTDGNLVEFNGTGGIAVFGNPVALSGDRTSATPSRATPSSRTAAISDRVLGPDAAAGHRPDERLRVPPGRRLHGQRLQGPRRRQRPQQLPEFPRA